MPGNDTFSSHSHLYIFIVFTPINYFYDAKKYIKNIKTIFMIIYMMNCITFVK